MALESKPGAGAATPVDGVAAVDRALKIVYAIEKASGPLSLADLARATGLYKSTLLRLIASLERGALVVRRPDHRYGLGPFAFRLGRAFETNYHLRECVVPVLEWLVANGTESSSFHVRHGDDARLCLLRVDSPHATLDRVRAGDLLPMDRGAPGRVLRTFRAGWDGHANVELVSRSIGERDPACGALSCPVFGPGGELLGAISLSGPLERFTDARIDEMSRLLLAAAETASRALGGPWPSASRRGAGRVQARARRMMEQP